MNTKFEIPQLFLRLALGLGFLLPVMDRLGWLGVAGENGNAWGNWTNFVNYTHSLMPYLSVSIAGFMAILATIAEVVFGITLILGIKTKWSAWGSFALTLIFALSMFIFAGLRAPFNYSVFVVSASSLVLAAIPAYPWSADQIFSSQQ